ncbi:RNA polymerase II subunit 5-mediating protein homolog isoform X2 [Nilaparvata lugens]|uniref:RNA polymerase II subunit 5-mediating protein homolog isoform X2 n=1 Tax=Nilaparvata lugens TaxID=108931 RepID=UPI00193C9B00|nr:RNA polymerase II subunit 5-mediating protein homolog isoform X2 [Nilaparvata lugens]
MCIINAERTSEEMSIAFVLVYIMDNEEISDTDQILPKPSQLRYLEYVGQFPPNMEEFEPLMLLQDEELEDIINEVGDRENLEEILRRASSLAASKLNTKSDREVLKDLLSNRPELRRMKNEGLLSDLPPWLQKKIDIYLQLSSDEDSRDEDSSGEDSSNEDSSASEDEISILYKNSPGEKYLVGFKDDCFRLLSEFSESKNKNFEDFAKVWRKMKFSMIFVLYDLDIFLRVGDEKKYNDNNDDDDDDMEDDAEEDDENDDDKDDDAEDDDEDADFIFYQDFNEEIDPRIKFLNLAVPEMFLIAKTFMLPEYPNSFRKGALYLLCALYYRQPFKKDDALVVGTFAPTFDLTELCLFLQIRDGETEEGKKSLEVLFELMIEDGGISPVMPLHEPAHFVDENDLRAWYFARLLQEHGQIENGDLNNAVADYINSFSENSELKQYESLWKCVGKKGFQHSDIPTFPNDPDSEIAEGETNVKTVRDYLDEIPDPLPTPDPLLPTSSEDCIM